MTQITRKRKKSCVQNWFVFIQSTPALFAIVNCPKSWIARKRPLSRINFPLINLANVTRMFACGAPAGSAESKLAAIIFGFWSGWTWIRMMQVFIQLNSDNNPDLSILNGVIDIWCSVLWSGLSWITIRMNSDNNDASEVLGYWLKH